LRRFWLPRVPSGSLAKGALIMRLLRPLARSGVALTVMTLLLAYGTAAWKPA
jgi:hypothetical protein